MTPPQLLKHLVKISRLRPDRIACDSSNVAAGTLEAQQRKYLHAQRKYLIRTLITGAGQAGTPLLLPKLSLQS